MKFDPSEKGKVVMKAAIWIVLAAIVVAAAYFVFVNPNMTEDMAPAVEPEMSEEIEKTAPVAGAIEEMQEAAESAAEKAEEAVEAGTEAAEKAVEGAVRGATDAAGAAEEAVDDAVDAIGTSDETAELTDPAELFTVAGFDLDKALAYIDASDLDAATKAATKAAIEEAKNTPELLEAALQAARARLGL